MEGQKKSDTIAKYKTSSSDTGSPEVQVALLTDRLESLSKHFQSNAKDNHSKRGMLRLVSRRARLLSYLKDIDVNRYRTLVASLGLRK